MSRLQPRRPHRTTARPPHVVGLAGMLLVGSALCAAGALWPATPASPAELSGVLAVVGALAAAALWLLPGRRWVLHLSAAVYLGGGMVAVASAATGEGAASSALSSVWLCVYAAFFFDRRVARGFAAASAGGMAAALVANPVIASPRTTWATLALTLVIAVEVVTWLLAQIRGQATVDPLTGLPNRFALAEAFERSVAQARRTGSALALGLIDLDGFKAVNDRDGHAAGDRLLHHLAAEWRGGLRGGDGLFRYGGDEFVVLLPEVGQAEADELLRAMHERSAGRWSYGVTAVRADEDLVAALDRADRRMYRQKGSRAPVTPDEERPDAPGAGSSAGRAARVREQVAAAQPVRSVAHRA